MASAYLTPRIHSSAAGPSSCRVLSGFFSDSLRRRLVDVDYYVSLGGYAYGTLGRSDDVLAPIFAELSKKFVGFVDGLSEVSERVSLTSDADVLRLYEKWIRTRSRRNGDLLAEKGIVPSLSVAAASRNCSSAGCTDAATALAG